MTDRYKTEIFNPKSWIVFINWLLNFLLMFISYQLEEQKQAKVYEEFVREFEHDAPKVKTFVKGDVINSESSKIYAFVDFYF